jgi:hypothetical protein
MMKTNTSTLRTAARLSSAAFGASLGASIGTGIGALISYMTGALSTSASGPVLGFLFGLFVGGGWSYRREENLFELRLLTHDWELLLKRQEEDGYRRHVIEGLAKSFALESELLLDGAVDEIYNVLIKNIHASIASGEQLGFVRLTSDRTMELEVLGFDAKVVEDESRGKIAILDSRQLWINQDA